MRYGTYTTFDCPTQQIDEAREWLEKEFEQINGYVKKVNNPHDLGSYPSFEIDYPEELEDIDEEDEDEDMIQKKNDWHNKANIIEDKYNKKFEKYL